MKLGCKFSVLMERGLGVRVQSVIDVDWTLNTEQVMNVGETGIRYPRSMKLVCK